MRVAILTLPLHSNYGGILQAYALQTVIERMGNAVDVLNKSRLKHISLWRKPVIYIGRFFEKVILKKNVVIREETKHNARIKREKSIQQNTSKFVEKYIHARNIATFNGIRNIDYDAFVVGSDQVWRKKYINDTLVAPISDAFLGFARKWNVCKIAYAASFGVDEWEYSKEETAVISQLLRKFKIVSVREASGIRLCREYCNVDAKVMLDPTLLLTREDYNTLIPNANQNHAGELFVYVLDRSRDKELLVERVATHHQLAINRVGADVENRRLPVEERIQPPIEDWLSGIANAKMVITDSFHACLFSIIYHKPFVVIGNPERGMSRFQSILSMLHLSNHLLCSVDDYNENNDYAIDNHCYVLLKELQKVSYEYLQSALAS